MEAKKKYGKPPCIFKVDISFEQYQEFLKSYHKEDAKEMLYWYFDTSLCRQRAKLLNSDMRLRVRSRGENYSLELKRRPKKKISDQQSEELFQQISLSEINFLFQGIMPEGVVKDRLLELDLLEKVKLVGTAYTVRHKRFFHKGILVLDKTTSLDRASYQIEFRSEHSFSDYRLRLIKNKLGLSGPCVFLGKLKKIWARSA